MSRRYLLALAAVGLCAGQAGAGVFVPDGELTVELLANDLPVVAPRFELSIRSREEDPPRVVAESTRKLQFKLPEGNYDIAVYHDHLPTRPLKYHRFVITAKQMTVVRSNVKIHFLEVRPMAGGQSAWSRVDEIVLEVPHSGEQVRLKAPGGIELPEGQYDIRVEGRGADGRRKVAERRHYLACEAVVEVEF